MTTTLMSILCVAFSGLILELSPAVIDQESAWALAIPTVGFLLMSIAWLFTVDLFSAQNAEYLAIQVELQRIESEKSYAETLHILYEHLQGLRHDFKNQLLSLYGYVEHRDWNGLEKHLTSLQTDIELGSHHTLTQLPQLDALLSIKLQQAAKLQIKTDYHFVAPTMLPISTNDLCAIFGNILDNAIEAAQIVPEKERYLTLSAAPVEDMWCICLENSSDGKYNRVSGTFLSSKLGAWRGMGLKRVQSIAEAAGGFIMIDTTDTSFCIEIYLPWSILKR